MTKTMSRRGFMGGRRAREFRRILPPGITEKGLLACNGCGSCAEACPTHIIGLVGDLPSLQFSIGECTFCGECANACPEHIFEGGTPHGFPHIALITDSCLAHNRVECQSCRDACPTEAIRFRPRAGGPFLPVLDPETCNGCGACISVCPITAIEVCDLTREVVHA